MSRSFFKLVPAVFALAVVYLLLPSVVLGQIDSLGIAIPTEINSDGIEVGHIICSKEGGAVLCDREYDASMLGVVTSSPALSFRHEGDEELTLVLPQGNTLVKVSSLSGNIEVGDYITTSEIPGVGQKGIYNGYVLGTALESFSSDNPQEIGEIYVSVNIHPVASAVGSRSNIVASLRQALSAPVVAPLATFRYLLAFIIAIISFALGFLYFGKVINSGVEAIGRNPLAKSTIQRAVILNVVITLSIVLTGLAIALLILIL